MSAGDRELRFAFAKALPPNFHLKVDAMIDQIDVPIPLKTKVSGVERRSAVLLRTEH